MGSNALNLRRPVDLTVVVISYNACDYIGEAVASIAMQDFDGSMEVLFYDDGSTDGTAEMIRDLMRGYGLNASLTVMDRSRGPRVASMRVSRMIREALAKAEGEYLCIISGDDYYIDPSALSFQIDVLGRGGRDDIAFCATSFAKVFDDGGGPILSGLFPREGVFDVCDYWAAGRYVHLSACMFRNPGALSRLAEKHDLNFIDDTGFLFMAGRLGKAQYVPRLTFAYRQHAGSIMDSSGMEELELIELLLMAETLELSPGSTCAYSHQPRIYFRRVLAGEPFSDGLVEKYAESLGGRTYRRLQFEGDVALIAGGQSKLPVRARRLLGKCRLDALTVIPRRWDCVQGARGQ